MCHDFLDQQMGVTQNLEDTPPPSHLRPPASVSRQDVMDNPPPSVPVNYEVIDQLLYVEQQKQTSAQEQHSSQLNGLKMELRAMRRQLRPMGNSSRQLVSALTGLNHNISGLRSEMQGRHSEIMGVMGRIAAALEANAVVRCERPEPDVSSGEAGQSATPKQNTRQLRERKGKK